METPKTGYQVQSYSVPVKRYCQTLDLRDSPELIAEYRKRHSSNSFIKAATRGGMAPK